MKFCKHKFKITNQFGEKFCELCGRKKGDYIHQLEEEVIRLRRRDKVTLNDWIPYLIGLK